MKKATVLDVAVLIAHPSGQPAQLQPDRNADELVESLARGDLFVSLTTR